MVQMIEACDSVPQDLHEILSKCNTIREILPRVKAFVSARSAVEVDASFMAKFKPMLEGTTEGFRTAYAAIHAYSKTIAKAHLAYNA